MQPLKPYFLGAGDAAGAAPDELPEGLPHGRPRRRRHDRAPPHVLRDARQLLDRRLLQARGGRASPGSSRARASASPAERIWITVFEGDEALGLGPDEEAIEAWLAVGVPRERIVAVPAQRELLAGRPDRAVRPLLGALPRPRPRATARPTTCRAARTSASSSSGTSSSCSTTSDPAGHADAAAGAQHRHRPGPQPHGGDPAGQAIGLRDRPVRAADRAGRGALGRALRQRATTVDRACGSSPTTRAR